MKIKLCNLLGVMLAVTIYLTNGDVVHIERNWLVRTSIFALHTGVYVQYTIEDTVHKIPIHNVLEIVETPYKGEQ